MNKILCVLYSCSFYSNDSSSEKLIQIFFSYLQKKYQRQCYLYRNSSGGNIQVEIQKGKYYEKERSKSIYLD